MSVIVLPKSIFERFKRLAEAEGIQVEELIVERLVRDLDPKTRVEAYWEMCETYLKQAKEEMVKGDLKQASEKIWGSAALAVKAVAYAKEGRRLTSHRELWEYVNKLIKETDDEELGNLWRTALSMHISFYEGWAPREEVERALKNITNFLEKLKKFKS
ncbi:MAG: hypothetical protein DRJ31_06815 [Candidatus Methanomethylicota archaeon]|uniref:HEPN domain-containing protein n=1 Tax=Thermoproteota archaeon TaxID=2056631 RepID=A0A497ENI9_9CREN|nr:MAG: hypothetical protein DRJ31_06815 [Candidatus Verstraetearchaeota archaeon]